MTQLPAGARVMVVTRGNLELTLPITADAFRRLAARSLAAMCIDAFQRSQRTAPGNVSEPIEANDTPLALRVKGRDNALDPDLPLLKQTEGLWTFEEMPVQGQSEATARLPLLRFELIDVQRPALALI